MTRAKDISKITTDANFGGTLDVTGAVTADLLTVNGTGASSFTSTNTTPLQINGASIPTLRVNNTVGSVSTDVRATTTEGLVRTTTNHPLVLGTNQKKRINISSGGDISFYEDTGTTPKFFWDASAEKLGIGSSSPVSALHVQRSGEADIFLRRTDLTNKAWLFNLATDGNLNFKYRNDDGSADGTSLVLDRSGNVGIGTSSPTHPLHIKNETNANITFEDTTDGTAGYIGISAHNQSDTTADRLGIRGEAGISFSVGSSTKATIDSSGNLLVGTTSTTIDTSNYGHFIASNGQYKHARNADSTQYVTRVYGNAGNFNIAGDGDATNTNNSYAGISDRTLKENIENANSQWDDIKAIEIKNYNLIEYPNKRYLGVIAQDLEETGMSSLVKTDEDGIKSVKYSILYMKAVKALQEAMTRIETLETANTALEARIVALETA